MLKIDNDLLVRVGLGSLPPDLANMALRTIYDLLEARVGIALADRMTNDQLDEFESFFNAGDDAGAFTWLSNNFPDYKDVVQAAFDHLAAEAASESAGTLEAVSALTAKVKTTSRPG